MDYNSTMISNLLKWNNNLTNTTVVLLENIHLLRDANDSIFDELLKARRDIDKLTQQLNDVRKELADLKKTEDK